MSKEHIMNICKRIDENKATEEEVCYLRDLALEGLLARPEGEQKAAPQRCPQWFMYDRDSMQCELREGHMGDHGFQPDSSAAPDQGMPEEQK